MRLLLYSNAFTLDPGEIIATGTPESVGPIEPGDRIVLTVAGAGQLTMAVVARSESAGRG